MGAYVQHDGCKEQPNRKRYLTLQGIALALLRKTNGGQAQQWTRQDKEIKAIWGT